MTSASRELADDFEKHKDILRELATVTAERDTLKQQTQAIALNAAMTALETIQAQGYFLHHHTGRVPDGDEMVAIITRALDAALSSSSTPQEIKP